LFDEVGGVDVRRSGIAPVLHTVVEALEHLVVVSENTTKGKGLSNIEKAKNKKK